MSAFQGDQRAKRSTLAAVEAMEAARQQGVADDADLRLMTLPDEMGIPRNVLALAEATGEGLGAAARLGWARRFLEAVSPGAELDRVWRQWLLWGLRDGSCGLMTLNSDTLAQPTLELLERFYVRRLLDPAGPAADIARIESIVLLMEQDAAAWGVSNDTDFREARISRATRAFWNARDGAPQSLVLAARAAWQCRRQAPRFSELRCEALLDLVAHAPVRAVV